MEVIRGSWLDDQIELGIDFAGLCGSPSRVKASLMIFGEQVSRFLCRRG